MATRYREFACWPSLVEAELARRSAELDRREQDLQALLMR